MNETQDLYTNHYECTKCGQPCNTYWLNEVTSEGQTSTLTSRGWRSICCQSEVTIMSSPYIVTPPQIDT